MPDNTEQWLKGLETANIEPTDARLLRAVGEAVRTTEAAEAQLRAAVLAAHDAGHSWTQIANVLGVSRQAARQRFAQLAGRNT